MHEIKLANEANGPKIMALLDHARKSENTQRSLTVDCSEVLDLSAEAMATLVRVLSDLRKDGIKVRLLNPRSFWAITVIAQDSWMTRRQWN